jgi:hypothetical protein
MTKDNHLLGKFDMQNIPPAPRGVPQVEVTFEIDVNGVLRVSAEDKGAIAFIPSTLVMLSLSLSPPPSRPLCHDHNQHHLLPFTLTPTTTPAGAGAKESITISNDQNRLSPEDIDAMLANADKFAEEDKMHAEKVAGRNELEGYLYVPVHVVLPMQLPAVVSMRACVRVLACTHASPLYKCMPPCELFGEMFQAAGRSLSTLHLTTNHRIGMPRTRPARTRTHAAGTG